MGALLAKLPDWPQWASAENSTVTPSSSNAFATVKSAGSTSLGLGLIVSLGLSLLRYLNKLIKTRPDEWESLVGITVVTMVFALLKALFSPGLR